LHKGSPPSRLLFGARYTTAFKFGKASLAEDEPPEAKAGKSCSGGDGEAARGDPDEEYSVHKLSVHIAGPDFNRTAKPGNSCSRRGTTKAAFQIC